MPDSILNFLDNDFREPRSRAWLDDTNPATGESIARLPDSGAEDVDDAVRAAHAAFPGWSSTPAEQRSKILLRLADLIEQNLDALALAECHDTGKPLSLCTRVDIPRAASNFRFFAHAITTTRSEFHDTDGVAINYTLRRPLGVVGAISPWNLPLYLFTWKIAPALATGNCVVAKPSEVTPMTAFLLAKLCVEAGLPRGALNILHGRGATCGGAIVEHPLIKAITFTGGTTTGETIARSAAPRFKKLSLELGGKNPNLVFADADMDDAIETSVRAAFTNQGQICLCGSRVFVERPAYDAFVERFVERASRLKVGDPLDPGTDIGSLVSREHREKVARYVDLAREEGGEILLGGRPPAQPVNDRCARGAFYEPTVITGLSPRCRVQQEEIFGPVVTITPFDDEAQAIEFANCTPYGLASTVWTRDLSRAHRVAARIEAGIVWVNCWMLRDLRTPFGGVKHSGVGREGGDEALRFFTEPKNVCVKIGHEAQGTRQ
ncbi:MAG: aldehyde dehydrogenase [Phycisphaeraceae bacterium]|nr:aldehyde dehydrogenase [Phycisphaeraceae bacterium]